MTRCIDCEHLEGKHIPKMFGLTAYCPIKKWKTHYSVEEIGMFSPCDNFKKKKEVEVEYEENWLNN